MTKNDSSVIAHINLMQDIIRRMASNSASCKQWCVVTITALIAYSDHLPEDYDLAKVCLVPLILFCFLDCYYLGLERLTREQFNDFVDKLNHSENIDSLVFCIGASIRERRKCDRILRGIEKRINQMYNTVKAFLSFSVFPFYLGIFLLCKAIE